MSQKQNFGKGNVRLHHRAGAREAAQELIMLHHTDDPAQRAFDIARGEADRAHNENGDPNAWFETIADIADQALIEMVSDPRNPPRKGFTPRRHPRRGASFLKYYLHSRKRPHRFILRVQGSGYLIN